MEKNKMVILTLGILVIVAASIIYFMNGGFQLSVFADEAENLESVERLGEVANIEQIRDRDIFTETRVLNDNQRKKTYYIRPRNIPISEIDFNESLYYEIEYEYNETYNPLNYTLNQIQIQDPFNTGFIPIEDVIQLREVGNRFFIRDLNSDVCTIIPEFHTNDVIDEGQDVINHNINKKIGHWYVRSQSDVSILNLNWTVNCEGGNGRQRPRVRFDNRTLFLGDNLLIDFHVAYDQQNITTDFIRDSNKITFGVRDGQLDRLNDIDPKINYNFSASQGVNMWAYQCRRGTTDGSSDAPPPDTKMPTCQNGYLDRTTAPALDASDDNRENTGAAFALSSYFFFNSSIKIEGTISEIKWKTEVKENGNGVLRFYQYNFTSANYTANGTVTTIGFDVLKDFSQKDIANYISDNDEAVLMMGYDAGFGHNFDVDFISLDVFFNDTTPLLNFTSPTFPNNTAINTDFIFVNLSSVDDIDHFTFIDFQSDLFAWWRFDNQEISPFTYNIIDQSTYSRNLTWINSSKSVIESGKWGNSTNQTAAGFKNQTGGNYSNFDLLDASSGFTISLWANRETFSASNAMIFAYENGTNVGQSTILIRAWNDFGTHRPQFNLKTQGNPTVALQDDLATDEITTSVSFIDDTWHHVVVLYNSTDNGKMEIYFDNALVSRRNQSAGDKVYINEDQSNLSIGKSLFSTIQDNWVGQIDEILIFNRTLSSDEIGSLYTAQSNQYSMNFSNLEYGFYNVNAHACDTGGNRNSTQRIFLLTDGCIYTSGNFEVMCSNNCTIDTPIDLQNNNISLNDSGVFRIRSNISNVDYFTKSNQCLVTKSNEVLVT